MSDSLQPKLPVLYWIIGVLLLLWGVLGVVMYLVEHLLSDEKYLEVYKERAMALRHEVPAWSIAGYAIGVWTGLAGAIALLLRKAVAVKLYWVSLVGAAIGWIWYVIDPRALEIMSLDGGWYMAVIVFALCGFSIWWAGRQKKMGRIS